ncbi:MAG: hypothetical protein AABW99_01710 [archaeon]
MAESKHYARAPKISELKRDIKGGVDELRMPKSAFERMSFSARAMVKEKNVNMLLESARGRPIGIPVQKMAEIIELHRDHRTFREIERITGIPKSTAHYLIAYAERQKIREGNKIVYL